MAASSPLDTDTLVHSLDDDDFHDPPDDPSAHPPIADPKHMQKRRRVTRACDECRRKKIKCDGKQPCTHCTVYSYGRHRFPGLLS